MDAAADIDVLVSSLQAIADRLRAEAAAPAGSIHTIPLKTAAYIAGVSEAQMRRRCEDNVYGVVAGGYGFKKRSRWAIVFAPFINSLPVNALRRVK